VAIFKLDDNRQAFRLLASVGILPVRFELLLWKIGDAAHLVGVLDVVVVLIMPDNNHIRASFRGFAFGDEQNRRNSPLKQVLKLAHSQVFFYL